MICRDRAGVCAWRGTHAAKRRRVHTQVLSAAADHLRAYQSSLAAVGQHVASWAAATSTVKALLDEHLPAAAPHAHHHGKLQRAPSGERAGGGYAQHAPRGSSTASTPRGGASGASSPGGGALVARASVGSSSGGAAGRGLPRV